MNAVQQFPPRKKRLTALQHDQRLTTLSNLFHNYTAKIATIGTPTTPVDKRRLTMARKMLKRIDAELRTLQ